ncbi:MAG: PH domain-containing protein [Acidimicrobiales bacterium]
MGQFPRKYLNEGEEIVLELHPHWSFFITPVASLLGVVLVAGLIVGWWDSPFTVYPALFAALVAIGWCLHRYARWATTNFVVTTDRLIHRHGVLAKKGKEIPLERLNDVSFHRRLIQRMLGAGDILIESGGERGQQRFDHIVHPEEVQSIIYREIEAAKARDLDRAAGHRGASGGVSPLEQLEKLEELRQRGVISQAEFEAKKAQLLDRL